ncbi:MAG: hypothetical protein ACI9O0_000271 [Paracoccaceae bacterium]|jgi:hypothetical protein
MFIYAAGDVFLNDSIAEDVVLDFTIKIVLKYEGLFWLTAPLFQKQPTNKPKRVRSACFIS